MTTYDQNQLDKLLKRRIELDRSKKNAPPQLHVSVIAKKFGLSQQEVVNRL